MVMCIPLIYISNWCELVQTYQREKRATDDSFNILQVIIGGIILGESESVASESV